MRRSGQDQGWWRELDVAAESGVRWTLGAFGLTVFRMGGEWQVGHERDDAAEPEGDDGCSVEALSEPPDEFPNLERFVAEAGRASISLLPRVADRSVVARPRMPLHVLPGRATKVYVSVPVWVDLTLSRPSRSLRELPVKRLSNTWFGPSTREGEVAYALKTYARARLEEMPRRTYRAITPIVIRNKAADVLLVDRMSLPIPYLSVWGTSEGHLWTEQITLAREEGDGMSTLDVKKGAPREAVGAKRISEPRRTAPASLLVRAFTSLLRPFDEES